MRKLLKIVFTILLAIIVLILSYNAFLLYKRYKSGGFKLEDLKRVNRDVFLEQADYPRKAFLQEYIDSPLPPNIKG